MAQLNFLRLAILNTGGSRVVQRVVEGRQSVFTRPMKYARALVADLNGT